MSAVLAPNAGARVVSTVRELRALPVASVVETGSGFRYVRKINGRWACPGVSGDAASSWLLDPEHSVQPIRLVYVPGGAA